MCKGSLDDRVTCLRLIKPFKKSSHLIVQLWSFRRSIMDFFPTNGAGYNLHRTFFSCPPGTNCNFLHSASCSWKEGSMPSKQPFVSKRGDEILCGVEHHFNNTFNVA